MKEKTSYFKKRKYTEIENDKIEEQKEQQK